MKISTTLQRGSPSVSFEVFSSKRDTPLAPVKEAVAQLAAEKPSFMSVTYGAAGGSSNVNASTRAEFVHREYGVTTLAHFCLGGACYPEGHPECAHLKDDIEFVRQKTDASLNFAKE